ncbi:uncharacterized protein EV420DRAFT_1478195 [Desarmillaria tabescens]|uniref:Uncharacterized protein n=1 Tax=Armillaria tabescens TaxID=1929756 RepID=A0AA39N752_ARMTA|nr:uncharacterized protein EV420DRAFT_1478195 [Desarmillaria tabescens]KAK0460412.1 hypothetical protein EV420DRAFT_1478195 [Desarmillaria tabescens]
MQTSKVQLVEESVQTAARRLAEVQAKVDELRFSLEAEELRTSWGDHARLVEELANLMCTFDDIVASRIQSRLVDDHRIQDMKERAQTEMTHASAGCQSVSDQLSRQREQRQQAIADGVTRQIQEDSGARVTEILNQLTPLRNHVKELREGLDTSIEDEVHECFQREWLARQRKCASSLNTMRASLEEKFAQFTDQCHQDEVAMEGDLTRALSEATTSEKGYAVVLKISRDLIQDRKKSAAQEKAAHAASLRQRIASYRERHGQFESSNEGTSGSVRDHVAWLFVSV